MHKRFITAQQLLEDSQELALRVIESGFRPALVAGVWRGGAPVAVAVHEVFEFAGLECEHCPISTRSYTGIARHGEVEVRGLDFLKDRLGTGRSLLIVDDVFDSGRSLWQVLRELREVFQDDPPVVKLAVPWYKPTHNETPIRPDWFLRTTADWLVFPHELAGLDDAEIRQGKAEAQGLRERLLALRAQQPSSAARKDTTAEG